MNKEELEAFERLARDLGRVRELYDAGQYRFHKLLAERDEERQKVKDLRAALNESELYSQAQGERVQELQRDIDEARREADTASQELQEALDRAAEPDAYAAGDTATRCVVMRHVWWNASLEKWVLDHAQLQYDIFRNADDPNNGPPKLVRGLYTVEDVQAVLGPKGDDQ